MFFLIPSLNIGWALWVLEGLCLLALMGFSTERFYASTHLLALTPLSLEVTWACLSPSGVWPQPGLPLGTGTTWRLQRKGDFVLSPQCVSLTQYFLPTCRRRSPESSVVHPLGHHVLHLRLLFGYFGVSASLTLILPYYQIQPDNPLSQTFLHGGWISARYVLSVGIICAVTYRSVSWLSPPLLSDASPIPWD